MPSPDKLAVNLVFEAVRKRLADDGSPVEVVFGWAEQTRRSDAPFRLVFVPGDGDNIGGLEGPHGIGGPDRALATIRELVTIDVHAYDGAQKDSELAQYTIARKLLDALIRAIVLAYGSRTQVAKISWVKAGAIRPFGRCARVVISVQSSVTDSPFMGDPGDVWVSNSTMDGVAELDVSPILDSAESY